MLGRPRYRQRWRLRRCRVPPGGRQGETATIGIGSGSCLGFGEQVTHAPHCVDLCGSSRIHQLASEVMYVNWNSIGLQLIVEAIKLFLKDGLRNDATPVSYTHLRAHETVLDLVCRLLLE